MKKALLWIFYLFVFVSISAQKIAVKTNILYDVTTTLNIGAEFRVAPKWTIDLSGNYNPFKDIYKNEDFDNFVERILTMMISECAREFENLPIIEDVDILRNILYSGIWAKFKAIRNKRRQVEEEKND